MECCIEGPVDGIVEDSDGTNEGISFGEGTLECAVSGADDGNDMGVEEVNIDGTVESSKEGC